MRRFLVKLVGLVILVILGVSSSFAQDYFGGAQWIGAITRQQAHIPEGRHYQGAVLKESKSLWAKADTLSRRSIILRRSFKPWKTIKKAEQSHSETSQKGPASVAGESVDYLFVSVYIESHCSLPPTFPLLKPQWDGPWPLSRPEQSRRLYRQLSEAKWLPTPHRTRPRYF